MKEIVLCRKRGRSCVEDKHYVQGERGVQSQVMRSSWTLRPREVDASEREVRRVGMHFAEVINLASKGRVCGSYQPCVEGQGCVQPSWQRKWSFAFLRLERCVQEAREEEIEERKKKYSLASTGE